MDGVNFGVHREEPWDISDAQQFVTVEQTFLSMKLPNLWPTSMRVSSSD